MSKLFQTMKGHTDSVNGVAFFHDGYRVVTGSWDRTLRIWDAQKGTLVGKSFEGHKGSICSVVISPDDTRIASGGEDTTVIIWDVESRQKVFDPLVKHQDNVWSLCFSPDGKKLASGSEDEMVVIWDTETGAVFATLLGHRDRVLSVAFSPDGLKLATGSSDTTIIVWQVDNAKRLFQINARPYSVGSVVWSPDGQQLVSTSGDKTIKFWDGSNGNQIQTDSKPCTDGHTGWIDSLAISSDGTFIATASEDKTVRLWSTETHQQIEHALKHTDEVYCVAISPNGTLLASGGRHREVYLWSIGDALKRYDVPVEQKEELELEQQLRLIDVSPQQDMLPTYTSEGCVHDDSHISSAPTLRDVNPHYDALHVPATPQVTMEGEERAGDKHDGSLQDVQLFQELHDARVKESPTSEPPEIGIYSDVQSSPMLGHVMTSQTRDMTPQGSLVQAESDSRSSVPLGAMFQDCTKFITKVGIYPAARGGFAEVWKCIYHDDCGPTDVAVKALLVYASEGPDAAMEKNAQRMRRELAICARLKHKNIMPVFGYTYGFGQLVAMVCPWAKHGNLTTYLEREDATLTIIRRFQILTDIAAGLQYLHAINVIHGDLTGPNVLIHADGTAWLADFGLSLVFSEVVSITQASWTSSFHGNLPWLAPELLGQSDDTKPVRPSMCSDIYSFGGLMLQVLTSKIPYYYLNNVAVGVALVTGVKPLRSRYPLFSDTYWHFIEECWSSEPKDRPVAKRLVEVIGDELKSLSTSSICT